MDPFFDFMTQHLSIRERELHLVRDEYAFLQSCGGVSHEDMVHFRNTVLRHTRPVPAIMPTIKQEPHDEPKSGSIISLKSMLLDIITHEQADNINKICRHVRPLLDREGIRTFCRHHATHVRSADLERIRLLLQREGMVVGDV
jgi:hypothetical protein